MSARELVLVMIGEAGSEQSQISQMIHRSETRSQNRGLQIHRLTECFQETDFDIRLFEITGSQTGQLLTTVHCQESAGFIFCLSLKQEKWAEEIAEDLLLRISELDQIRVSRTGVKQRIANRETPLLVFASHYSAKNDYIRAKYLLIKEKLKQQCLCIVQEVDGACSQQSITQSFEEYIGLIAQNKEKEKQ